MKNYTRKRCQVHVRKEAQMAFLLAERCLHNHWCGTPQVRGSRFAEPGSADLLPVDPTLWFSRNGNVINNFKISFQFSCGSYIKYKFTITCLEKLEVFSEDELYRTKIVQRLYRTCKGHREDLSFLMSADYSAIAFVIARLWMSRQL